MKRIAHVHGGLRRNVGDIALAQAMQEMLQKKADEPIQFINIDCKANTPIDRNYIDYINQDCDMLIIGGGGFAMQGDGFQTRSGWQFNCSATDLDKLKTPLVVYGIGFNVFPYDKQDLSKGAVNHLKKTQNRANLFSVRDTGSKQALVDLGLDEMEVIPDPAMFLDSTTVKLPDVSEDEFIIAFNWAGDRENLRFKENDLGPIIDEICEKFLKILDKAGGGKVVYIPHINKYDIGISSIFKEQLGDCFYPLHKKLPNIYPESQITAPIIAGVYKRANIAVGMRGHAQIIPFGQTTPIIGFGNHAKIKFFAEETNTIYVKSDCKKLEAALNTAAFDRVYFNNMKSQLKNFRVIMDTWNERVIEAMNLG